MVYDIAECGVARSLCADPLWTQGGSTWRPSRTCWKCINLTFPSRCSLFKMSATPCAVSLMPALPNRTGKHGGQMTVALRACRGHAVRWKVDRSVWQYHCIVCSMQQTSLPCPRCRFTQADIVITWRKHFVLADNMLETECTNLTSSIYITCT